MNIQTGQQKDLEKSIDMLSNDKLVRPIKGNKEEPFLQQGGSVTASNTLSINNIVI